MLDPNSYTVGWICAAGKELVAAQVFLDEKYDVPDDVPVNDNNTYTLGRIGNHKVVIAVMPHKQQGLVSAAIVARDMVRSFPNVRLGLMVGIGGGAPSSKYDIRLGDIVVSSPDNDHGGMFQYDYGKTIQGERFTVIGHLNQPPLFVLSALAVLQAYYTIEGHTIQETIDSIIQEKPQLLEEYKRPSIATDRLYKSNFKHQHGDEASCEMGCGDNESNLIPRTERGEYQDNPAIHYGLIASANQLMKNALIRDELSKEKDVLCFEMAAAGVMNHFPCLVIRGISNYSDTHNSSAWQGYAAMAAAAYAKDLLRKVVPNKVEAERRLSVNFSDGDLVALFDAAVCSCMQKIGQ
ncbi:purine and uridine phosphorylase [Daldinia decipiens]|uniref:purine and uridine phosphorylase n=1 Tax=Daldinia decipiens TaxID=326647 RepID=UPI0020C2F151|nr:purine and uridine phosphorylase [Daldinia decipiens]KAI1659771.1 purine and uridine phosphorylase [Daldinia decipiens]